MDFGKMFTSMLTGLSGGLSGKAVKPASQDQDQGGGGLMDLFKNMLRPKGPQIGDINHTMAGMETDPNQAPLRYFGQ